MDAMESPLTELGLIRAVGKRDGFRFVRGPKPSLHNSVFAFALIRFWQQYSNAMTLSYEAIAHLPGWPGRIFLLDESDLVKRLADLDEITGGLLRWAETAGLKQVIRDADLSDELADSFVDGAYSGVGEREAA